MVFSDVFFSDAILSRPLVGGRAAELTAGAARGLHEGDRADSAVRRGRRRAAAPVLV
jgi:hypothetical protein